MNGISRTALLLCAYGAAVVACGSGPIAPKPTPGAESCGTILAAGVVFGDRLPNGDFDGQTAVIFRLKDDQWTRAELPEIAGGRALRTLSGVSFSGRGEGRAWAWGGGGEIGGLALQSIDDGRTWQDVTHRFPAAVREGGPRLLDAWFPTEESGWLATSSFFSVGPATIYFTTDSGTRWDQEVVPALTATAGAVFGGRGGVGEIVIWGAGTQIVRLDDFTVELVGEGRSPSASSPISLIDGLDYATRDTRGWVAGRSRDDTAGAPVVYSAALGEAWIEQPVGFDGLGALLTIDFSGATTGVTCGFGRKDGVSEPLCFWTTDGGSSWRRSDVAEFDVQMRVMDVALCPDGTAWAVAEQSGSGSRVAFLRSDDGGESWVQVSVPGVEAGRVRSLSRDGMR